jgi:hypothetical protein
MLLTVAQIKERIILRKRHWSKNLQWVKTAANRRLSCHCLTINLIEHIVKTQSKFTRAVTDWAENKDEIVVEQNERCWKWLPKPQSGLLKRCKRVGG